MSIRESAREEIWSLGSGPNSRQNEGLPMVKTRARRPIRICRVDAGQSSAAFTFCCAKRKYGTKRCETETSVMTERVRKWNYFLIFSEPELSSQLD